MAEPERRRDPPQGRAGATRAGQPAVAPAGTRGEGDEIHDTGEMGPQRLGHGTDAARCRLEQLADVQADPQSQFV